MSTQIFAAIVGGFLAAGTGWLLQKQMLNAQVARQRSLYLRGIRDDLTNSIALYDRVMEDWEKSRIVWFNLLNEIGDSRHVYVNHRDLVLLIEPVDLRNRVLKYYHASGSQLMALQNAQQRKHQIEGQFNAKVQEKLATLTNITREEAVNIAVTEMAVEDQELAYWNEQLPVMVGRLESFKAEARDLLKELDGLK